MLLYNPLKTNFLLNAISELKLIVSLPLVIRLGLKRIVSPSLASIIDCLSDPTDESLLFWTSIVIAFAVFKLNVKSEKVNSIIFFIVFYNELLTNVNNS